MRKLILFCVAITLISILGWNSISSSSETKTLGDYKKSLFFKKYLHLRPMEWPLEKGGYSNSFSINLGIDQYSVVMLEILTKSKNDPTIYRYSLMFHSGYAKQMKQFFNDFISSIDSALDQKTVVDYIQKRALLKLKQHSDAPNKTFGRYIISVGNVLNAVSIKIERIQ